MPAPRVRDVIQIELRCRDLGRTRAFYRDAFGWRMEPTADPKYLFADPGQLPIVALLEVTNPSVPPGVTPYLAVDDCAAALAQAVELGARPILPRTACGSAGFWSHAIDPWGNEIAFWESAPGWSPPVSAPVRHPIVWLELRAPELAQAVRFYRTLCGWHFEITPGVDDFAFYRDPKRSLGVGLVGGARAAGMRLTCYAATADLDGTLAALTRAGGRVALPTARTTDGRRFAVVLDPEAHPVGLYDDGARP